MGNRSTVYFWDGKNDFSSGVYQQWNGGRCWWQLKHSKLRAGSPDGCVARYAAECCKRTPGNLSVYVFPPPSKKIQNALKDLTKQKNLDKIWDTGPLDNGTYLVNVNSNPIRIWQISKYFENRTTRKDFTSMDFSKSEYLDKVECRELPSLPSPPDDSGFPPKRMPKKEVQSSTIKSIGVSQKHNLLVEFRSGSVYRYYKLKQYTVESFLEAESKGKFLNRRIKGCYPYKLVSKPKKEKEHDRSN